MYLQLQNQLNQNGSMWKAEFQFEWDQVEHQVKGFMVNFVTLAHEQLLWNMNRMLWGQADDDGKIKWITGHAAADFDIKRRRAWSLQLN